MKKEIITILAIETSCDETAVSLIEMNTQLNEGKILSHVVHTQIEIHKPYGGVYPEIAKRDHIENIIPVLKEALSISNLLLKKGKTTSNKEREIINSICSHEEKLSDKIFDFFNEYETPEIDYLAVTNGPGLSPALWVGVNSSKSLALLWEKPLIPVNHMLGHTLSSFIKGETIRLNLQNFPALSLLLSGAHTEISFIHSYTDYEIIGKTVDDALGEAFDKTARLLGIPYPGGRELNVRGEKKITEPKITLPRPMIHSGDLNFSFSGLKTSVLYLIRDQLKKTPVLTEDFKDSLSYEFHLSVIEVILKKLSLALKMNPEIRDILVGGGVIANTLIKKSLTEYLNTHHPLINLHLPEFSYATDNATMIALAAYAYLKEQPRRILTPQMIRENPSESLKAQSNLSK